MQLAYEERGEGDAVVFLHGSLQPDGFRPLIDEPALARFHLVRYWRRGYLGHDTLAAVTIEDQAADCAELMRQLHVRHAHVVGHSYGGAIALQVARDHPTLVDSLVLIEPALVRIPELAITLKQYQLHQPAIAVSTFLELVAGPELNIVHRLLPSGTKQALAAAQSYFGVEMPALQSWQSSLPERLAIDIPILLMIGRNSPPYIGPRIRRRAHDLLDALKDCIAPHGGHYLHVVDAAWTASSIATFFATLGG